MNEARRPLRLEVEWIDSGTARTDAGWETAESIQKAISIGTAFTSGYLLGKDTNRGVLYLAQSYDPEHANYLNAQAIQVSNIVRIWVLRAREEIVFDNLPE